MISCTAADETSRATLSESRERDCGEPTVTLIRHAESWRRGDCGWHGRCTRWRNREDQIMSKRASVIFTAAAISLATVFASATAAAKVVEGTQPSANVERVQPLLADVVVQG